jgi:hypothetical protein
MLKTFEYSRFRQIISDMVLLYWLLTIITWQTPKFLQFQKTKSSILHGMYIISSNSSEMHGIISPHTFNDIKNCSDWACLKSKGQTCLQSHLIPNRKLHAMAVDKLATRLVPQSECLGQRFLGAMGSRPAKLGLVLYVHQPPCTVFERVIGWLLVMPLWQLMYGVRPHPTIRVEEMFSWRSSTYWKVCQCLTASQLPRQPLSMPYRVLRFHVTAVSNFSSLKSWCGYDAVPSRRGQVRMQSSMKWFPVKQFAAMLSTKKSGRSQPCAVLHYLKINKYIQWCHRRWPSMYCNITW